MEEFNKIRSSLSILYEIIEDNSKVLRVKNDLLKKIVPYENNLQNKHSKIKNNKQMTIFQEND